MSGRSERCNQAMNDSSNIEVLNRLLAIQYRSLPMYLTDACPWIHAGDEQAATTLANIVTDQQRMVQRIADLILDRRGAVDPGEFPMEFTDTHMLSLDFLLNELIHYQKQDVAAIEDCVRRLARDPVARALAEEALGSERAHLEALERLAKQPV
jgi:hypothetical protein